MESTITMPPALTISITISADQFAKDFGPSFERYGFAIIADHGMTRTDRNAWEKAKAFFALPEEVKRGYLPAGGGGARGYTPFGIETAKGATTTTSRNSGTSAANCRRATFLRVHAANVWPDRGPGLPRRLSWSCSPRSTRPAPSSSGDRPLSRASIRDYFDRTVKDGNRSCACSTIRRSAGDGPERARRRARGHQHDHPAARRRGRRACEVLDRDGHWLPVTPQPGGWWSTSATCCSG